MSRMRALGPALNLLGLGWYVAISIIGGIGGGLLLDRWLDTEPLFTLLGLALGLIVAFYGGYKMLKQVLSRRYTNTDGDDE